MTALLVATALSSLALLVYGRRWMCETRREIDRLDDENRRLRTELAVLRAAHRAREESAA